MLGFISGFLAPFRGFARLIARPKLWPLAAIPVALNVALCVLTAWGWFGYAEPALEDRLAAAAGFDDGFFGTAAAGSADTGPAGHPGTGSWAPQAGGFASMVTVVLLHGECLAREYPDSIKPIVIVVGLLNEAIDRCQNI